MDFIIAPLVTFIVFASIYGLFELFVRRRERMAIIEKFGDKFDPRMIESKLSFSLWSGRHFSSLKIACLMIGLGIGLLVGMMICGTVIPDYYSLDESRISGIAAIIYGSCLFISGGLGLLIAFFLEMKSLHKDKN